MTLRSFLGSLPHARARNHPDGDLAAYVEAHGSDKWGAHWYAQHYETHFAPHRSRPINLLEIGVGGDADPSGGGGSLRAWQDYFPRGRIVGLDIHDKTAHNGPRIRTFQGNQADPEFLKRVVAETARPDIVIDDGSHLNEHVITSFQVLFPLLSDNGIYAVEDTQTSYWPKYGGGRNLAGRPTTIMEFFKGLCDGLNHEEFLEPGYRASYYDEHIVSMHFYHNLLFVYKGTNDEGSNCVQNGVLNC